MAVHCACCRSTAVAQACSRAKADEQTTYVREVEGRQSAWAEESVEKRERKHVYRAIVAVERQRLLRICRIVRVQSAPTATAIRCATGSRPARHTSSGPSSCGKQVSVERVMERNVNARYDIVITLILECAYGRCAEYGEQGDMRPGHVLPARHKTDKSAEGELHCVLRIPIGTRKQEHVHD